MPARKPSLKVLKAQSAGHSKLETRNSKLAPETRNSKLLHNLHAAAAAPRCQHVRFNGQRCAAPARSGSDFCIFHAYDYEGRVPTTSVPEDAASVQLELGRVIRQLQDDKISPKSAALILYALQIASMNLKRLSQELPTEPPESALPHPMEAVLTELRRLLGEEAATQNTVSS